MLIIKALIILIAGLASYSYVYIYILKPDGVLNRILAVEEEETLPGEREVKALAEVYGEIEEVRVRDGDWSFILNGTLFYWSGGRILPESLLEEKEDYSPHKYYYYPADLPAEPKLPDIRDLLIRDLNIREPVNTSFLDTLYGGATYRDVRRNVESINFLGFRVNTHKRIIPLLREIEREIIPLKEKDKEIENFISNLRSIDSLSWRNVEGSMNRSLHSYGIAIDFMPRRTGGREIYWAWTRHRNRQWYKVPYERRFMVPDNIVKTFEKYGFIWGGKWLFYDNIHFEYRPEILILSGREVILPDL